MVVYPCDIHKVSRLLTGKRGQLRKEVPSVAMMTNFYQFVQVHYIFCKLGMGYTQSFCQYQNYCMYME